jgi:hypothetical protein
MNKKKWYYLFLLSQLVLSTVIYLSNIGPKPFGDGDFHIETKTIVDFIYERDTYDNISVTKAPGPILFYIIPYLFVGKFNLDIYYLNISILWSWFWILFSISKLYLEIQKKFDTRIALIFMLIMSFFPYHFYYMKGIWAESVAFISVIWIIILLLRIPKTETIFNSKWFVIILFHGLLFLSRPNSLLILFFYFLYFFISKGNPIRKFILFLVFGSTLIVGVTKVLIDSLPNRRLHQTLNQNEYFWMVAHEGRFQFRDETWDWRHFGSTTRANSIDFVNYKNSQLELEKINDNYSSIYKKFVINDILNHPLLIVKQILVRFLNGFCLRLSSFDHLLYDNSLSLTEVVFYLMNLINYSILILGLWGFSTLYNQSLQLLILIFVGIVLFSCIVYMEQRYLFPVRVIIYLASALKINEFISKSFINDK